MWLVASIYLKTRGTLNLLPSVNPLKHWGCVKQDTGRGCPARSHKTQRTRQGKESKTTENRVKASISQHIIGALQRGITSTQNLEIAIH